SPMDKLAVALWAQAGVLLIVAVAQQFDGFGQSVSWLAIAVASIEVGRRLPSRGVDIFGLVVGGLALVRIGLVDSFFSPTMDTVRVEFAGVKVTDWAILVLIAVLVLNVAAHRIRGGITPLWGTVAPATLAALGALGWLIVTAVQCDGYAGTTAWLAGTLILLALSPLAIRERYLEIALMLLLATGARWLLVDAIAERLDTGWNPDDMLPWINPQMGLALGIAATGVWATRAMNVRARVAEIVPRVTTGWAVVLLLGIIFLLVGASFEVDRLVERLATGGVSWAVGHVRQLLLTMLWALGSVGIGLLARTLMASSPDGGPGLGAVLLRRFAWAMLAACIVKWLLGDTLYWSVFGDPRGARALSQLVNVQMIVALVLGGGAITLWAMRGRGAATDPLAPIAMGAPVAAAVVVLWGLSFEIDRVIGQLSPDQEAALLFDPWHLRALWWTGLWAAGGFVMTWLGNRRSLASLAPSGWLIIIVSAIAWLTWDTLAWRIFDGRVDATVFLNLQCGVGVLLIVLIAAAMLVRRTTPVDDRAVALPPEKVRLVGYTAIALLGLWLGSLEIDRLPVSEPMARQAGLSVYWAIYGVALVVLGFVRNAAAARYAGLALLTITIAKVLLVDLATIGKTWRVLSALVSGLLLIGTSILYTRLSPQLLGRERDPDDEDETVP
ncbi:MAG: DUF2339 domain-containing protein, partial [Planctomycetes bacterium]|nr:DUF2339 domain-containing protein [Planctomycetota bacterium]